MTKTLSSEDQKLRDEFEKLINESFGYNFKVGQVVNGSVIAIEKNGLLVDIGAKSEAFVPLKEISNVPFRDLKDVVNKDDEREFYILREEDEEGQITLSLKRVALAKSWDKLDELKQQDQVINAKVSAVVKGGVVVDVLGLRGFVPASQLRSGGPYDGIIGQDIPMKILETDAKRNKLILSQRQAIAEQKSKLLSKVIQELTVDEIVDGEVVRIADFGAFIDIKGVDGLLPISEISWHRVRHPSDILSIGQKLQVKVLKIDKELNRISLSLKRMEEDPWLKIEGKFSEGEIIEGTVNKIAQFGAFVDIFPGVEALLPISEMSDEQVVPHEFLSVGQRVRVVVKRFTPKERRISLSIKGLKDAEAALNQYSESSEEDTAE